MLRCPGGCPKSICANCFQVSDTFTNVFVQLIWKYRPSFRHFEQEAGQFTDTASTPCSPVWKSAPTWCEGIAIDGDGKYCTEHCEHDDQLWIFWAHLVEFEFKIMWQESKCEVRILGFSGTKIQTWSGNLGPGCTVVVCGSPWLGNLTLLPRSTARRLWSLGFWLGCTRVKTQKVVAGVCYPSSFSPPAAVGFID